MTMKVGFTFSVACKEEFLISSLSFLSSPSFFLSFFFFLLVHHHVGLLPLIYSTICIILTLND